MFSNFRCCKVLFAKLEACKHKALVLQIIPNRMKALCRAHYPAWSLSGMC